MITENVVLAYIQVKFKSFEVINVVLYINTIYFSEALGKSVKIIHEKYI
jgi:hypothetical protein